MAYAHSTSGYYPYGMQMPGADGEVQRKQPYKFGGKEHLSAGGLNIHDFGPRALYAPAGQFSSADPKCEDYPHLSPYLYCAANPVNAIDPTGEDACLIIDGNRITILANIIIYGEGDSDLYKALDEKDIVFFPTMKRHFKSLNPDSIAREYGSPVSGPFVISFRPSEYDEEYCKRWHTNRLDEVYGNLVETNTIVRIEELTPILSRIDEFRIGYIKWEFKEDIDMEVIYLVSDSTLIPIDGWIADKDHFIFKRI